MARSLPVLLVALLLLSIPGAGLLAAPPDAVDPSPAAPPSGSVTPANTTAVLLLDGPAERNFSTPTEDFPTRLDLQRSGLDRRFAGYLLAERLENADSAAERERVLGNVTDDLAALIAGLRDRERQAREAYVDGRVSPREYVRTLAYLDARAGQVESVLEDVQANATSASPVYQRIDHLKARLATLQGPVRHRAANVVRGEAEPFELYVSASDTGVVLAVVDGDSYVRETYRSDNIDEDARTVRVSEIREQMEAQYPWAMAERRGFNTLLPFGPDAGHVDVVHGQGRLDVWIDGSTGEVYRETQYLFVDELPAGPTVRASSDEVEGGLVLTVNRTYAGGPLSVRLTNATGTPVDGEIQLDSRTVGTTGQDGVLWTLAPGGTYTVTAVHRGELLVAQITVVRPEGSATIGTTTTAPTE